MDPASRTRPSPRQAQRRSNKPGWIPPQRDSSEVQHDGPSKMLVIERRERLQPSKCAHRGRGNRASSAPSSVMRMPLASGVVVLLGRALVLNVLSL